VIDYVEVVNADTLENVDEIKGRVLVALAVKFEVRDLLTM